MLRLAHQLIVKMSKHEWVIFLCVTAVWLKLVTGFGILPPSQNSWLLNAGDLEQHYLGWEFLRHEALYFYPLGKVVGLGSGVIPSIVYTDSIPLIAVPLNWTLKLLDSVFGIKFETFQFTGCWIAICIYLQYSGSFYCLKQLGVRSITSYAYGLLFIIAPFLLWRLPGIHGHVSLFSQWLILWSFYLFMSRRKGIYWVAMLAASFAIHAYCGAIVFVIFIAHLIDRFNSSASKSRVFWFALFGAFIAIITLLLLGYFELSGNVQSGGYGTYKWNTLSWLNGTSSFSRILGFWDYDNGEYEGFSYLGLSTLFFIASGLLFASFRKEFMRLIGSYRLLGLGCLLMCLFAMTLSIGIGAFQVPIAGLPPPFRTLGSIFRASGRFSWPMMYLVMLFSVSSWNQVAERFFIGKSQLRGSIFLAGGILLLAGLQIADSAEGLARIRSATSNTSHTSINREYKSVSLNELRSLVIYPSDNYYPGWHLWWRVALANDLTINAGSFARYDQIVAKKLDSAIDRMLTKKNIDRNSLVITTDTATMDRITAGFESCSRITPLSKSQGCYINIDGEGLIVGTIDQDILEYLKRLN